MLSVLVANERLDCRRHVGRSGDSRGVRNVARLLDRDQSQAGCGVILILAGVRHFALRCSSERPIPLAQRWGDGLAENATELRQTSGTVKNQCACSRIVVVKTKRSRHGRSVVSMSDCASTARAQEECLQSQVAGSRLPLSDNGFARSLGTQDFQSPEVCGSGGRDGQRHC